MRAYKDKHIQQGFALTLSKLGTRPWQRPGSSAFALQAMLRSHRIALSKFYSCANIGPVCALAECVVGGYDARTT